MEGLAIANGFVYRGKKWPQLQGAVVFGDITSGRLFYARMTDLVGATDGNPTTLAPYSEITTTLSSMVQERLKANPPPPPPARPGGPAVAPSPGPTPPPAAGLPATAPAAGPPPGPRPMRLELRIATDQAGEIYVLTKSDGVIRRVATIR